MTFFNLYEEMWGYAHEDDTEINISKCILTEGCENEVSPLLFYDETTPVKDCGDLVANDINYYNKEALMGESFLQVKRRRTLQFKSEDSQSIDGAVSELSQWVSSFTENTFEDLDMSSEKWVADCFNDAEMYLSSDDNHTSGASGESASPVTEVDNILSSSEANVVQDQLVRRHQNVIFKGTNSYLRAPSKSPASVVYPFDFIKPCGARGDITLKDINQKISAPSPKPRLTNEDLSVCYPKSAFSGKPVIGKTKICTEGGKGSIIIMRTKG